VGKLTFYFDRCFGKRFPEALRRANPPFNVEYHQKCGFKQDTTDDEWLEVVGKRGWVVFSHDRKFHSEALETAAVVQFGVGCFYLYGANSTTWEKLELFIRAHRKIFERAASEKRPYIYNVGASGRLKQIRIS